MIRRLLAIAPVWWLSAVLGAIAAVLLFGVVRHYEPIHAPEIAWWALALIVLVTERWPVELEFRRSSHSFSLTDVPLTLALIFASGTHAFAAVILGVRRRAAPAAPAADQVLLQRRPVLVRDDGAAGRRAQRRRPRRELRLGDLGVGPAGHAARRRAHDRPDHRRDRPHRGPRLRRPGPPDVRHGLRRHGHRHRDGAGLQHPLDRAAVRRAAAGGPDPGRLPRLPRLRAASARATRRSSSSTRPTGRCRSRPRSRTRSTGCSSARWRPSGPSRPR